MIDVVAYDAEGDLLLLCQRREGGRSEPAREERQE
jgi:hypothetical protein